ncbi:hypothetical protein [Chroococcidiopsis sp. TS-821]|uniref:hypothetical protein n=1 Tax=Chroococcidiopsis sp. TS-821 TaxID=1378066 RepID=UPI000CEE5CC1|nr:hypothetical protein [Chroococcidiopsis sp. TS-821]PPS42687.1 hypothetical protein B1A85_13265 [Chroococcidiopsis sp. TS-821]
MAIYFRFTTIVTFVVGVQLFNLMETQSLVSILSNTTTTEYGSTDATIVLAADLESPVPNFNTNSTSRYIPPRKSAPKSTQGSGTR